MLNSQITGLDPKNGQKVASIFVDFTAQTFKSSNPNVLTRPYISLNATRAVNYFVDTFSLINTDQNFGLIKSLSFVFRPNYNAGQDYAEQGINLLEALPKVIVYNQGTRSTVHIETNKIPAIDIATVGVPAGFYNANDIVVQGCVPFYGQPLDTIEVCNLNVNGSQIGFLQLYLYNFDVTPFYNTAFSNFVKSA